MRKFNGIVATLALGAIALMGCNGSDTATAPPSSGGPATSTGTAATGADGIVIAWAQWKPADWLQTLANEYTAETKIPVKVEQIPWPDYQNKITTAWSAKSDTFDLIVGDSQWLGQAATEGHYVDLTDWSKDHVKLDEMSPAAVNAYGEYPAGSKKLFALPCESDAIGFAYRKDLFDDHKEKDGFKKKYNRDLAPPKTWQELRDIAEFFTRPAQKLYGAALFYSKDYDGITMGADQYIWCEGGDLHDPSGKVEGVINSPTAVAAIKAYAVDLRKFNPTGAASFYFDDTLAAFAKGQVAIAEEWFAFMPGFTDPNGKNKQFLDKTGYFMSPAGRSGHFIQLGGQGISLSTYSKKQDQAKQFLEWFEKKENQQKWAKLGGLTANKSVQASPEFATYAPYNSIFADSQQYLKDFYNIPSYAKLLDSCQKHWNAVAADQEQPQQAMDAVAKEHTQILKDAKVIQ